MKIIITENQYNKLQEDLEYWGVSDATKDRYEMGSELDEDVDSIPIYKEVNPNKKIYEKLRKEFSSTPNYILNDFFRNVIMDNESLKSINNTYYGDPIAFLEGSKYWRDYLNSEWELKVIEVNPNDFDDTTLNAFFDREFGEVNTYDVPKDKERMDTQMSMRRSDGNNEPVILLQNPDGNYELVEGWHRTMSILKMGDNGEDVKNWDKVKLRSFIATSPEPIRKN
tara:strand:- start:397 stop:1071 length:675 start_codon:yes stop_codon:yes gene_type:complete